MRIDVTDFDIRSGLRREPCACPVALAIERAGRILGRIEKRSAEVITARLRFEKAKKAYRECFEFDSQFREAA